MIARAVVGVLFACVLTWLSACGGAAEAPQGPHLARYTVRARIVELPSPESPAAEFKVRHEEIPDFRASWPDGALGMKSMTMPFPVAESVALEPWSVGDAVTLTFEVRYARESGAILGYEAVALEPLPDSVELQFEVAEAPAP